MVSYLAHGEIITVVVACFLGASLLPSRANIPEHLLGHDALVVPGLLSPEEGDMLMELAKSMKSFPTNVEDVKFYKTQHEHIGEAAPPGKDGGCSHPYLVLNNNRTLCAFPGRIDIGRHYLLSGGVLGLKQEIPQLVSRLLSFGRYIFDLKEYPTVAKLFDAKVFQAAAKRVCPANQQVLDPFQFNFIVQLPGQTVATHIDGVYFWGADRFVFPQWLLAVMKFSGLFEEQFIHQVQVVGYFHRWNDTDSRDGQFVYWSDKAPIPSKTKPTPLAGSVVDGSKTVHAATVYQPSRLAPNISKNDVNELRYEAESDRWDLISNSKLVETYDTDDLRWTIVYRARCFESEEKRKLWHSKTFPSMKLESVLETLKDDLVARGRSTQEVLDKMTRLELGVLLMEEYIKYPLSPTAAIPYNYCALTKLMPWTRSILRFIC